MPLGEIMKQNRPKWFIKDCEELDRRFAALMAEVGATLHADERPDMPDWKPSPWYTIKTKAGELRLTSHGDGFYCRFEEPLRAQSFVSGVATISGKWNHSTFWSICKPRSKPEDRTPIDYFFNLFESQLRRILP